jgi:hypothetical protein
MKKVLLIAAVILLVVVVLVVIAGPLLSALGVEVFCIAEEDGRTFWCAAAANRRW